MLCGRSAEREQLEQLLDAVGSGPVGCILEGMPGIGKTTLWRDSVESARRRGLGVLESAPSEPDRVLAFSGLCDLFEQVPEEVLETLPDAQARALRAAVFQGELPEVSPGLQTLPRAVLGVLRQLAMRETVLIAIDDEQWLDRASARVLAFALCRIRDEPIGVILARRPEPGGALSVELESRFGGRGLETIQLGPLPMDTIKALLEERLKRPLSLPLLRRIQRSTGGNPLYAVAIGTQLEAHRADGDRSSDLPMSRTLTDAIELRLEQVDRRADPAMLAIAALSQPTLAMLQAAIPEFELSDLESAERAGVIEISGGRLRFTHPLLASTHYANTPVSQRRKLHRLLATVLDDEEEQAHHLALGAEAPEPHLADTLESAAGVAARRGAIESAAQLMEDAARLTPMEQPETWSARVIAAAEHRFRIGEVARARSMLEEVIPGLTSGPLRSRARLQLAEIFADQPRVGMELLEAALDDAGEDDRLRVEIESALSSVAPHVGRLAAARAHAESAVRTAERTGDPNLVATALGELLVTVVMTGEPIPRDVLARLTAMEDVTGVTAYHQPSTAVGLALYYVGDAEHGRPLLERAAQQATARGEEWDRLGLLLALAGLEWDTGNLQLAEQHRNAVEDAAGEFADASHWLLDLDARYALDRGNLRTAETKAELGLAWAEREGSVFIAARLIPTLAGVYLASGRPELAHARLAKLRDFLVSSGFGPAGAHLKAVVWSRDVEALLAMGQIDEAEAISAELRARADVSADPTVQGLASRCEGLLLAARGDTLAAIEAMDAAVAAYTRCQMPLEHGRTLFEKGSLERRAKRKAAAKQTLEEALAILEPLGTKLWISRARDELDRIGLRRPRPATELTPTQVRVGELVAAGLTNPEIGRQLHMSVRTVESHLSHVYREHGVRSRSQLAAALAASGAAPVAAPSSDS